MKTAVFLDITPCRIVRTFEWNPLLVTEQAEHIGVGYVGDGVNSRAMPSWCPAYPWNLDVYRTTTIHARDFPLGYLYFVEKRGQGCGKLQNM